METLEMRFYSREEIGVLTGNPDIRHKKFAERVRRVLDKHGYLYQWERGKGVNILDRSQSAEQRFRLLMTETFGFDSQIDAYQFACFIGAFCENPIFCSMPWNERVNAYKEYSGIETAQSTMCGWLNKLVEKGLMTRNRGGLTWKMTYNADNTVHREVVDTTLPEYKQYNAEFSAMLSDGLGYGPAKAALYKKHGYYLNKSPEWVLTAWGDDNFSDEVAELHQLALDTVHERKNAETQ